VLHRSVATCAAHLDLRTVVTLPSWPKTYASKLNPRSGRTSNLECGRCVKLLVAFGGSGPVLVVLPSWVVPHPFFLALLRAWRSLRKGTAVVASSLVSAPRAQVAYQRRRVVHHYALRRTALEPAGDSRDVHVDPTGPAPRCQHRTSHTSCSHLLCHGLRSMALVTNVSDLLRLSWVTCW
jgi:hypothetical protein